MKKILFGLAVLLLMASFSAAADDPLGKLTDETLQFFKPVSGKIIRVESGMITFEVGPSDTLRPGMRLNILSEGEPFRHPVTREILGNIETQSGRAEVREVKGNLIDAAIVEGSAKVGDNVRISATRVKMVFVQEKRIDWYLADDLYRRLKASDRIEMVDTALETGDEEKVIEEAKKLGVQVALLLTGQESEGGTLLREQLFWVPDGTRFYSGEAKVDIAFTKDLRFGAEYFSPLSGEAIFRYDLNYRARFVVTGDFDGDGKQEIAISTGTDIRTYLPAVDLKPLWEVKGSKLDDHIWVDAIDLNGNGKEELITVSMINNNVVSSIYELAGSEFRKIGEVDYFLRRIGSSLVGQRYSASDGFKDDVFHVVWDGAYRQGDKIKLPRGITIYDYVDIEGPAKEHALFTYDEKGFLNIFDNAGMRIWKSSTDTGGFITTFKKPMPPVPVSYGEGSEWSIKDRLLIKNKEVLVINRVPLLNMARGIGYKHSLIKSYYWNGFSVDARTLVDDVPGTIYDYALAGDKAVVLASPFLGIKFGNILKGENPLGGSLYIYSIKGR